MTAAILYAIGVTLIATAGLASIGLITSMLTEYREKITAALLMDTRP